MRGSALCVVALLISYACADEPLVTLQHGGQLQGKRIKFNDTDLDIFIGVRYAEPPVGDLRFKKPQSPTSWAGVKYANSSGNICLQSSALNPGGEPSGSEDCLFLHITLPGTLDRQANHAVMLWIHGGGYTAGSGSTYIGAPLAVFGDVIVVTINYRLGILGFLSDGNGTGNFGLWDQRKAIIWVKENIDKFGGDPNKITIFGESAGAGSVSAQMMGQHNTGLFQRAIQQSGSLFTDWGWFLSERRAGEMRDFIKDKAGCLSNTLVYDCLRGRTAKEVQAYCLQYDLSVGNFAQTQWHPYPDNDFFSSDIVLENYNFPIGADLMIGFNGQEGIGGVMAGVHLSTRKINLNATRNGYSISMARTALKSYSKILTPMSINLCAEFLLKTYNITAADDDRERAVRLSYVFGELQMNSDAIRQLKAHSRLKNTTTYAYYFSNLRHSSESGLFDYPKWAKLSADHGDELPFVWGALLATSEEYSSLQTEFGADKTNVFIGRIFKNLPEEFLPLTKAMVTMWTNFAKTGDPNRPTPVGTGTPAWPQSTKNYQQFIEFDSLGNKLITTPNEDRIKKLMSTIFKARSEQVLADKPNVITNCKRTAE